MDKPIPSRLPKSEPIPQRRRLAEAAFVTRPTSGETPVAERIAAYLAAGRPRRADVQRAADILVLIQEPDAAMAAAGDGKLLVYCRLGMRSTLAWAVASRDKGVPREELDRSAAAAGFSLAAVDHLL